MQQAPSLRFAAAARALADESRRLGLGVIPSFRSPPGIAGADRTIRRRGGRAVTVSVMLRGRPFAAVVADLVEGVVVANRLPARDAVRIRNALWEAVHGELDAAA